MTRRLAIPQTDRASAFVSKKFGQGRRRGWLCRNFSLI